MPDIFPRRRYVEIDRAVRLDHASPVVGVGADWLAHVDRGLERDLEGRVNDLTCRPQLGQQLGQGRAGVVGNCLRPLSSFRSILRRFQVDFRPTLQY